MASFHGATYDTDLETGHAYRAPRFYRILGVRPEDGEPTREWWFSRIHPEDAPRFHEALDALLEGRAAELDLEFRVRHENGSWIWVWQRGLAVREATGKPKRTVGAVLDITTRKRAEERQGLLINELNHRVKNTLATVQSIAAQTLRNAPTTKQAREALEARLVALSRAHDVLTRESWEGAGLREIVAEVIEPYRSHGEGRFQVEGPEVRVSPSKALMFAMMLQELATNAVKYGALSNTTGRIRIVWDLDRKADPARLKMRWEETGGPPVEEPLRRGFGSRLIERGLARDIDGEARITFAPKGVICTIDASVP